MANSDWPGHAKFNRHPQLLTGCGPRLWFTQGQDPPFAYHLVATDKASPTAWLWVETTRYLGILRSNLHAEWFYNRLTLTRDEQIRLFFNAEGFAPTLHVTIVAAFSFGQQLSLATQVQDTGILEGDFISRGTVWTFPDSAWVSLVNQPINFHVPICTITATPVDCIPDWKYGDPLP